MTGRLSEVIQKRGLRSLGGPPSTWTIKPLSEKSIKGNAKRHIAANQDGAVGLGVFQEGEPTQRLRTPADLTAVPEPALSGLYR
jgi:hypothetical protein